MSHENPETAKIFLNLEDAPESNAMSADSDGFDHDQPAAPMRPQAMSTSSNSVASGPALIALIAILGGGSIFGMRVVSKHAAIAAESFVLDYTPPAIGTDFDSRFEATMLNLERSTRPVQVPIAYLQRDPFNFSGGQVIQPVQVAQVEDPMDAAERERRRQEALIAALKAEHQRQDQAAMTKALGGYQLQSTLQGSNPVARISGEIVRIGGTLSYEITRGKDDQPDTGQFTVEAIGGRNVILVAPDGSRYELAIGMPFRELEGAVEETPAEEAPAEEMPVEDVTPEAPAEVAAPVDEFAAAAAAAAAKNAEAKTPTETAPAETTPATESEGDTAEETASETESEAAEGEGAEPTFMERLKAASEALKKSEAETEDAADTESGTDSDTEAAAEVTDEEQSAESDSAETETEAADGTEDEATDTEENADESADESSDNGETEAADETAEETADESEDEAADETGDETDGESGEGSDDEGGR